MQRFRPARAVISGLLLAAATSSAFAANYLYRNAAPGIRPAAVAPTPTPTPDPEPVAPTPPAPKGLIANTGGVRAYDDGTYGGSCNGYLTGVVHPYEGDTGSGVYRISLNGSTRDVYCDMTTQGGGWTLVRRLAPTSTTWFPTTDNLIGGAGFGTYSPDPAAVQNNGLAFANIPYTEFRLSSGDGGRWMRFAKAQLQAARVAGCGFVATITDSSYSATAYTTNWCYRPNDASPEDPWITYQYGNANATLYGEGSWSYSWSGSTAPVGGINIFIR